MNEEKQRDRFQLVSSYQPTGCLLYTSRCV